MELYPKVITDTSLAESSEPADAAIVGEKLSNIEEKLSNALYVVSFDASTGTLVTRSADYEEET